MTAHQTIAAETTIETLTGAEIVVRALIDQGVEVLEFRGSDSFDIKMLANNRAYWDRAVAQVTAQRAHWTGETPPSGLSFGPEAGGG